jgi:hypothetical protein
MSGCDHTSQIDQFVEIHHMDQNTLKIKTVTSTPNKIKYGCAPRFSSGASFVFLFINDLLLVIYKAEVVLFADDTNILITANNNSLLNEKI